jgi:phosphoribosyl 1,2-cyclic phosphodiesterase
MYLTFWGTRGSIPVPGINTTKYGGNTTCFEINYNDQTIVVDAGTGIRLLGKKIIQKGINNLYLLMTHVHLDHIMGFPFFEPILDPSISILVDGHPSCMKGLEHIFKNSEFQGIFPIAFNELKAKVSYLDKIMHSPIILQNGIKISSKSLNHQQGSIGFRFDANKKSIVIMTDNELTEDLGCKGNVNNYVEFCKDADILIHDAQYREEEYPRLKSWGHSTNIMAIKLAAKANVKQLMLFHHDPNRTDIELEQILIESKNYCNQNNIELEIILAQENNQLKI